MLVRKIGLVVLVFGAAVSLVGAAGPTKDVAVTSLIEDYASAVAPSLQVQSDQAGSYTNVDSVSSVIQAAGAWVLETGTSGRTVYLGFTQPIAGSGPGGQDPVAIPSARYTVRIISQCNLYRHSILTMAGGSTISCPLHIGISYEGESYAIEMDPLTAQNGPFPETSYADIACIFPTQAGSPCSQWRFTPHNAVVQPDGTVQLENVGKLLKYSTVKGHTVASNQGDFYFSFEFLVTNP